MPNHIISYVSFFFLTSGMLGAKSVATSGDFTKLDACFLAMYLTPDLSFILLLFFFSPDFLT